MQRSTEKAPGKSIILSQKHDLLIRIGIGKLLHLMILQAVLIEEIFQQGERFLLAVVKDQRVAVTHILLNVGDESVHRIGLQRIGRDWIVAHLLLVEKAMLGAHFRKKHALWPRQQIFQRIQRWQRFDLRRQDVAIGEEIAKLRENGFVFCLQGAVDDLCFVNAEQRVLGQMVKKRGLKFWRKVGVIAENAGVAFFADVRETLLELLPHILSCACSRFSELAFDARDQRLTHSVGEKGVVRWDHRCILDILLTLLGFCREEAQRIDLIVKPLDAQRTRIIWRKEIDDATAACKGSRLFANACRFITEGKQVIEKILLLHLFADSEAYDTTGKIIRRRKTVEEHHGVHNEHARQLLRQRIERNNAVAIVLLLGQHLYRQMGTLEKRQHRTREHLAQKHRHLIYAPVVLTEDDNGALSVCARQKLEHGVAPALIESVPKDTVLTAGKLREQGI